MMAQLGDSDQDMGGSDSEASEDEAHGRMEVDGTAAQLVPVPSKVRSTGVAVSGLLASSSRRC